MRVVVGTGIVLGLALLAGGAQADVLASNHVRGYCLDINMRTKRALVWNCHGGFNQNFVRSYGQMKVNGECLDTVNGSNGGTRPGDQLILRSCTNSRSQKWGFDRATAKFRNEEGWCADIQGGGRAQGTPVVAWQCGSQSNQSWFTGNVRPMSQVSGLSPQAMAQLQQIDQKINRVGGNMVAAGGGNLVAAGGGNLVAAGGGNVVVSVHGN